MCQLIDPTFNIDRVVFSADEFMRLLNSGTLRKGNAILWDEVGVALPSREFMSIINRTINYLLQTFRRENLCLFFTVPDPSFIDIQTRKLLHSYIETVSINYQKSYVVCKFFNIDYSPRFKKVYYKYPVFMSKGIRKTIYRLKVALPSKELVKLYEMKRKTFLKKLGIEVEARIKKYKEVKPPELTVKEIKKEVEANIDFYSRKYGNRFVIDKYLIMGKFNIGRPKSEIVKKLIEVEHRQKGV